MGLVRATDAIEAVFASVRPSSDPADRSWLALMSPPDEHDNLLYLIVDRLRTAPSRALELTIAAADFWPVRGTSPMDGARDSRRPSWPRRRG